MAWQVFNFYGPFHFSHLHTLKLTDKAGIYIWGFAFDLEDNGYLREPVDFSAVEIPKLEFLKGKDQVPIGCNFKHENWKFIPYYVGKIKSSLEIRLTQHHRILAGDSLKKTRLHKDYYKTFFTTYPIHKHHSKTNISEVLNFLNSNPNTIEYYNNDEVLKYLYKGITLNGKRPNHYPIDNQFVNGTNRLNDSLADLIFCLDNFWFCFCPFDNGETPDENHEAQTYYSLKGRTISQTLDPESFKNKFRPFFKPTISCKDIFKIDSNGFVQNPIEFNGY